MYISVYIYICVCVCHISSKKGAGDWYTIYIHLSSVPAAFLGEFQYVSLNQPTNGNLGHRLTWLVVSNPLKNISQLGRLSPIYGKIKSHVPVTTNQWLYHSYIP